MVIKALNITNNSCRANLQYVGLISAGIPAVNKKMLYGGNYTEQIDGSPFTGCVDLIVNHGGLRNKAAHSAAKELFKYDVMPVLADNFSEVDLKLTGKIQLHFREGTLQSINLTTH